MDSATDHVTCSPFIRRPVVLVLKREPSWQWTTPSPSILMFRELRAQKPPVEFWTVRTKSSPTPVSDYRARGAPLIPKCTSHLLISSIYYLLSIHPTNRCLTSVPTSPPCIREHTYRLHSKGTSVFSPARTEARDQFSQAPNFASTSLPSVHPNFQWNINQF